MDQADGVVDKQVRPTYEGGLERDTDLEEDISESVKSHNTTRKPASQNSSFITVTSPILEKTPIIPSKSMLAKGLEINNN